MYLTSINNVRELVSAANAQYPLNIYLKNLGDSFPDITYADLDNFVNCWSAYLDNNGINTGERVVVLIDNTTLHALLFIAITSTDRIYVPINPRSSKSEIKEILSMTNASAIIYAESLSNNLPIDTILQHSKHICVADDRMFYNSVIENCNDSVYTSSSNKLDTAEIVFTSGSTGLPKGVLLSHNAILNNSVSLARRYEIDSTDNLLAAVPLFHCGGQMFTTMSPIWVGAQTTIVNPQVALMRFWEIAIECQITWSIVITAFLPILLSTTGNNKNVLKGLLVGGSAVATEVINQFEKSFNIETYQVYGMTELAAVCVSEPLDRSSRIVGTTGTPIDICDVKIMISEDKEASQGEPGEIYLTGENMFTEYMNNKSITLEKMAGKYIKSGDMGFIDNYGNLNVLDRIDNMFNVGSENVYPAEIERFGSKLEGIQDLIIIPVSNKVTDNDIVMVYKLKPDAVAEFESWETNFRKNISHYKIPKYKISISELELDDWPHTGSGKISRTLVEKHVNNFFSDRN